MNTRRPHSAIRSEILEEAAHWLVEFRAGEPQAAERRDFDSWLRASPQHVRAYLTLLPTWEKVSALDVSREPSADLLIEMARRRPDNVVPLGGKEKSALVERPRRRWRLRAIAAGGALAFMTAASIFYGMRHHTPTYGTAVGEQRSIYLTDGSRVELNARSRVRVKFDAQSREVILLEGQALFQVARDPTRPFIVHSEATRIRAVGTQFDVHQKRDATVVTVLEGRVAVSPASSRVLRAEKAGPLLLSAGQQVNVTASEIMPAKRADPAAATAWTQKRLIFSAAPLREVAEEFNRYHSRPLVIEDPELAAFRINGVYSSGDPAALLRFLRDQPDIAVVESAREIRLVRK